LPSSIPLAHALPSWNGYEISAAIIDINLYGRRQQVEGSQTPYVVSAFGGWVIKEAKNVEN
jgi:hypothetical protein